MALVIQTEDLDTQCAAWLAERCEFVRCSHEDDAFPELLAKADGLVVRTYTRVNEELLAKAPNLKVVGRAGVALENVDVHACADRGITVVHTPNSNTRAVIEYFTAILLDVVRPRLLLEKAIEPAQWHEVRRECVGLRELSETTLGILGCGRIGSGVARVARALDMRVLAHDIRDVAAEHSGGAEMVSLETLLEQAQVLSVHVDYRSSNRDLVNAQMLAAMQPDALLINTSRGFVVDAQALAAHLQQHPDFRAFLDVHDPFEPIPADYPLFGLENCYLSPHLASGTVRAKREMSWVVRDVWRVLQGEQPQYPPPAWLLQQPRA
jgi:phosphoglycerate dehydrogenase-like enzyme